MVRQGYKKTEIGVIPEDWKVEKFQDITEVITCGIAATPTYVTEATGEPFLSAQNVRDGKVVYENHKFISKKLFIQITKHNKPSKGDILYTRVGAGIGDAGVIEDDFEFAIYVSLTLIKPKCKLVDSYFISNLLNSNYYKFLAKNGQFTGAGVQNLNVEVVRNFAIPLPPKEEQKAITQVLCDVDALIAALNKLIAKKRSIKTGTMQQLLAGKKRLPGFSESWQIKLFSEIASCRKQRLDPRKSNIQEFCVELEHIESGKGRLLGSTKTGEQSSLKTIFQPHDILFSKLRSYLRKYWFADCQGVCSTEIWVLVPNYQLAIPEFLYQVVTTDQFVEAASTAYGTHMPRADWNVVKNYEVAVPAIEEQRAIATILSNMDAEIAALETRRAKTQAIKQGMMQELLTGKTRLI